MKLIEASKAGEEFRALLHEARENHERVMVCENGELIGVIFSVEDLADWGQRDIDADLVALAADPQFQERLRRSEEQMRTGQYLTHEEVLERFQQRCRENAESAMDA